MIKNEISNLQKLILFIIMIFLWIIWAGNTSNVDYRNYSNIYNTMGNLNLDSWGGVEVGFNFLFRMGNSIGLTYQQFVMVISFIALLLFAVSFCRISKYPGYLAIGYSFFPFLLDVMQMRNAIAAAIVANAIPYLIKKNYIKYTVLILAATLFHTTSLYYLLFLGVIFSKKIIAVISISISLVGVVVGLPFLRWIINYLPSGAKYVVYLEGNSLINRMLYMVFLISFVIISEFLVYKYKYLFLNKDDKLKEVNIRSRNYFEFISKYFYILLLLLPLLMIDSDFFRLFRNVFFVFINTLIILMQSKVFFKQKLALEFVSFLFPIVVGVNYLYWYQWDSLVIEILTNNFFFN